MRLQLNKEATAVNKADPHAVPIARGVDYLKKALAGGKMDGDAARALLVAAAKGYDPGAALDAALTILKQPAQWTPEQRIPFASALAVAERTGKAAAADLEPAAKLLVASQLPDGSWEGGAPILATWSARTTLISSGMQPDNFTIVQADRWTRGLMPESLAEASATILALELASDVMAENLRRTCLGLLRAGQQDKTGGWGTDADAAPQVFETALAVLALNSLMVEPRLARSAFTPEELKDAIAKGRQYLVSQQQPDGGWSVLTTSGWALLALMQ